MNSFQLINSHAMDYDYPLCSADIFNGVFEYEIEEGILFRIVAGEIIDIKGHGDILTALNRSRKKYKCTLDDERIFIINIEKGRHKYVMSCNIHALKPKNIHRKNNGEIYAPIPLIKMQSGYESFAFKREFIIENSFSYFGFDCVYFLLNNDVIQYVGESGNVALRLSQHVRKNNIEFNAVSIMCCPDENTRKLLESFYIYKFEPTRQGRYKSGRLVAYKNLLNRLIDSNFHDEVRDRYLNDFMNWNL
jgi:hypothetical protein